MPPEDPTVTRNSIKDTQNVRRRSSYILNEQDSCNWQAWH